MLLVAEGLDLVRVRLAPESTEGFDGSLGEPIAAAGLLRIHTCRTSPRGSEVAASTDAVIC